MKVLAIMCHPDDLELDCSGTLIRYKDAGHEVTACHAANGNMGHMVIMPGELAKIRETEAQNAARIGGFEVISAGFNDLEINAGDKTQIYKMIQIIRSVAPDVIITHAPEDYCSDHAELSRIVFNASFSATCPHFHPELGDAAPLSALYYSDTSSSVNFIPVEYVDISDVMDRKEKMLACHESQLGWLMEHDKIDIISVQRTRASMRGTQCGVAFAEGFRPLLADGRLRTYRVLP